MWEIRGERGEYRYSAFIDGRRVAHAAWVQIGNVAAVPHMRVDRAYESLGIGSELARSICRDARAEGLRVLALCPFMRRWAYLHPQFDDVLGMARPGEAALIAPMVQAAEFLEERRLVARRTE